MKDMNSIISHLSSKPQYLRLNDFECLNQIKNSLTPSITKGVKFIYKKNNTAFFALKHPVFKTEFDYNLKTIKYILKMLQAKKQICKEIQNIKSFVIHDYDKEERKIDIKKPEKASGEFDNPFVDKQLKDIFENIKNIIKISASNKIKTV
jgi:hypothetical protein